VVVLHRPHPLSQASFMAQGIPFIRLHVVHATPLCNSHAQLTSPQLRVWLFLWHGMCDVNNLGCIRGGHGPAGRLFAASSPAPRASPN
jgi:hypothetical protein